MSKKQRVHIISEDGTCANTQFLDADSGKPLDIRTYRVDLSVDARGDLDNPRIWKGQMYTYMPVVDILADAEIYQMCRYCKQTLPEGWEAQDTMMANVAKFSQEVKKSREKPLREALDFQHDIERVRGKFAHLAKLSIARGFPLEHTLSIIEKYEQAIEAFLGENTESDEGKEV